jgi:hypothetical protein
MAHSHAAEVMGLINASAAMKSTASAAAETVAVEAAAAFHKPATAAVEAAAAYHKAATAAVEAAAASHKAAATSAVTAAASPSLSRRHGADRCERQGARSEKDLECMFDRHMHDSFSFHRLIVPSLLAGRFRFAFTDRFQHD